MECSLYVLIITWCSFVYVDATIQGANVCTKNVSYTTTQIVNNKKLVSQQYKTCCYSNQRRQRYRRTECRTYCTKTRYVSMNVTSLIVVSQPKTLSFCCEGWTNTNGNETSTQGCVYSTCTSKCNPGRCIEKDECQVVYNATVGFKKEVLNEEPCQSFINNTAINNTSRKGDLKVEGNSNILIGTTKTCQWHINNDNRTLKFHFSQFSFSSNIDCADSIVTITTDRLEYVFCSERKAKINFAMFFKSKVSIKTVKRNWRSDDGFTINFELV